MRLYKLLFSIKSGSFVKINDNLTGKVPEIIDYLSDDTLEAEVGEVEAAKFVVIPDEAHCPVVSLGMDIRLEWDADSKEN